MHYTTSCNRQSSAPEDGRDQRLKHGELIGIINKPLLLHLVGVYIIYINEALANKYQIYKETVGQLQNFGELTLISMLIFKFIFHMMFIKLLATLVSHKTKFITSIF